MHLLISRYYETVSHESAENGEAEETGSVYDSEPFTFGELFREIRNGGFHREGETRWLTTYPEQDFRSGDYRTETLHFSHLNPPHLEKWFWLAAKWANRRR